MLIDFCDQKAMYRWIYGPAEREAILVYTEVRKANPTPDPGPIIEIACVSSPEELLAVKKVYQLRYKHSVEEDVAVRFTGDLRKASPQAQILTHFVICWT